MTDEEKLMKYLEMENDLLIFDESKKNAEIQKLKKDKSELNIMLADAVTHMGDRITKLESELQKSKNKN